MLLTVLMALSLGLSACGDNTSTSPAATPIVASTTAPATTTTPAASATTASTTTTTGAVSPTTAQGPTITAGAKPKVIVSSKNFTEAIILGEMYAAALENAGIPVERKLNLGTVQITQAAIVRGDISLYPEYTGTALLSVLKLPKDSNDPKVVYDKVAAEYPKQFKLAVLDPGLFNNTNAIVVSKAAADKYNLRTLSDLSPVAKELRLAAVATFTGTRSETDGLKSLQKTYGGFDFKEVKLFDLGLKYEALKTGQVDAAQAFSTDGEISGYGFVLLEDDKKNFPPYQVVPIIREDILAAYPNIKPVLNAIAPHLSAEKMTALNWGVDGPEKIEPVDVAKNFLKKEGLIK